MTAPVKCCAFETCNADADASDLILPDLFEKAYCRAGRDVERFNLAEVRYHHLVRRHRQQIVGHALPFVAEQPRHRLAQINVVQALGGVAAGGQRRDARARHQRRQVDVLENIQHEVGAHRRAQHLRRPAEGRAGAAIDLADARRRRAAQDRADVAGVLHVIEQHRRYAQRPGTARSGVAIRNIRPTPCSTWLTALYKASGSAITCACRASSWPTMSATSGLASALSLTTHCSGRPRSCIQVWHRCTPSSNVRPALRRACELPASCLSSLYCALSREVMVFIFYAVFNAASSSALRTGPKERLCTGEAPCSCNSARCSAVG